MKFCSCIHCNAVRIKSLLYGLFVYCVITLLFDTEVLTVSSLIKMTNTHNTEIRLAAKPMTETKVEWTKTSFHKGIEELTESNLETWKFEAELNIRSCHAPTATYIYDHGLGILSEDITSLSETHQQKLAKINPTVKVGGKSVKYKDFAKEYELNPGHHEILGHIHTEIVKTLSKVDKKTIRYVPFGDVKLLMSKILGNYVSNTAGTRTAELKAFMNLERGLTEEHAEFTDRIDQKADLVNQMFNQKIIKDAFKVAVLMEGVKTHHASTFAVVAEIIDQSLEQPSYHDVQARYKSVAIKAKHDTPEESNSGLSAKAKEKKKNQQKSSDDNECNQYKKYGGCDRKNCPYDHTTPGTQRCPKCKGKHAAVFCKENKPMQNEQIANQAINAGRSEEIETATQIENRVKAELKAKYKAKYKQKEKSKMTNTNSEWDTSSDDDDHDEYGPESEKSRLVRAHAEEGEADAHGEKLQGTKPDNEKSSFEKFDGAFLSIIVLMISMLWRVVKAIPKFMQGSMVTVVIGILLMQVTNGDTNVKARIDPSGPYERFGNGAKIGEVCTVARQANATNPNVFTNSSVWSIDSGCTSHITNDSSLFIPKTLKRIKKPIECANGTFMYAHLQGDVYIRVKNNLGTVTNMLLQDVLHVKEASSNLISVSKLVKHQHKVVFNNNMCMIKNKSNGRKVCTNLRRNLYDLESNLTTTSKPDTTRARAANYTGKIPKAKLWHRRLAHASPKYLKIAVAHVPKVGDVGWCEACIKGGMQKPHFNKTEHHKHVKPDEKNQQQLPKTTERMEKVMADACKPFVEKSAQGNVEMFVVMDVHTRKTWVLFGKKKSDFNAQFKILLRRLKNETGKCPVMFSPDGGGEFVNKELESHLQEECGTQFKPTAPGNPNQNPYVERMNGTIERKVKILLEQAQLPRKFWQEAAEFVVEIQNAMPHKNLNWKSPNFMWSNGAVRDNTIPRAKTFGCEAWYIDRNPRLRKGDAKARKAVYLGNDPCRNGYKFLDLETRKIVVSRDAFFNETQFPYKESKASRSPSVVREENEEVFIINDHSLWHPGNVHINQEINDEVKVELGDFIQDELPDDGREGSEPEAAPDFEELQEEKQPAHSDGPARNTRIQKLGQIAGRQYSIEGLESIASGKPSPPDTGVAVEQVLEEEKVQEHAAHAIKISDDFRSMRRKDILTGPLRAEFIQAEQRELSCIEKHGTWEVVNISDVPKSRVPITSRWVYDVKRNADNKVILYKARLTAHGYKQIEGVDYHETFSAVAQMKSFRTILALSQLLDWRMTQIDISNAFLHGKLEEEIYMQHPPGYSGPPGTCLRLKKGLYGLKQASRIYNEKLISTLKKMGFKQLKSDTQVLILQIKKSKMIVGIHVDDITLTCNDEELRKTVMEKLKSVFLVKDLGDISQYLGIRVVKEGEVTKIDQQAYAERIIEKFNLTDANCKPTPGVPNQQLSKDDSTGQGGPHQQDDQMKNVPYRSAVGSLMYSYIGTRPDIGSALIKVASFCENPSRAHWEAVKRIIRYLKGTPKEAITYSGRIDIDKGEKVKIEVFSDSDWAQDKTDRKSTSGFIAKIGGGPVSWHSKKQPTVALSACEAEFVALTEATKEAIWLTLFLGELGIPFETPVILTDSRSAMEWSKNACYHQRTKHVALKYFFVRDVVSAKTVKMAYINTKENQADIMTKLASIPVFKYLQPKMMGAISVVKGVLGKGVRQNFVPNTE